MKILKIFVLFAFLPFLASAQAEFLVIQTADTFMVYHIRFSEHLSGESRKVNVFEDFPQVIAKESSVLNGKLSGIEKTYYPSGKLYQEIIYADGKQWGEYRQFAEDGTILVAGGFVNDRESGLWIDNITCCTGRYRNGQKHGRWRCNEGEVPYTLYVYRKGVVKRVK